MIFTVTRRSSKYGFYWYVNIKKADIKCSKRADKITVYASSINDDQLIGSILHKSCFILQIISCARSTIKYMNNDPFGKFWPMNELNRVFHFLFMVILIC
jgi:hypothetical protein